MNDLLQLKGQLLHSKAKRPGPPELPKGAEVDSAKLRRLREELESAACYWRKGEFPFDPLVSVYYGDVVAKSNRIKRLLSGGGSADASDSIVGARFEGEGEGTRHVITHCVPLSALDESAALLELCASIVDEEFGGLIDSEAFARVAADGLRAKDIGITKTAFAQAIRDAHFAQRFDIKTTPAETADESVVVSIFDTGYEDLRSFLGELGLPLTPDRVQGNAVLLTAEELGRLNENYPFLVSMAVDDLSELSPEDVGLGDEPQGLIPPPGSEPIIGVIDTPFDDRVYFGEWVDSRDMLPNGIDVRPSDRRHGTMVSSLIVDGPSINPELDDGCGRFRVRHFGVAPGGKSSSFAFMRSVAAIVRDNRDIKVWNISLGSEAEVARNFISPPAAMLDDLQSKYKDIVFVVAGTNTTEAGGQTRIGSPADSINSLVVNATDFDGSTASYSRSGPVLDFFKKPDVCAVGGDVSKPMHVCTPTGEGWRSGTSYAAPWVARKMAYLMQVMGLSREVAKALVIDSAAGWEFDADLERGYGRVPIRIEDVMQARNDEIRFVITGTSEGYENYSYNIPVPVSKEGHPYIARATLCYFPECDRRQGVDYTSTEMDLHFGRVNDKGAITPINNNRQGEAGSYVYEGKARSLYRKWDNVKHIGEELNPRGRQKKAYSTGMWGIKVRTTERGKEKKGRGLPFGVVVTLKEINGVNRIDDFIQRCSLRGWIVTRVDVQTRIDVYNAAEVEIDFDE